MIVCRRDLEFEVGQFEAIREEEKQKYGYGETIDYSPKNVIPTAVDGLVRLVLGVTLYMILWYFIISLFRNH